MLASAPAEFVEMSLIFRSRLCLVVHESMALEVRCKFSCPVARMMDDLVSHCGVLCRPFAKSSDLQLERRRCFLSSASSSGRSMRPAGTKKGSSGSRPRFHAHHRALNICGWVTAHSVRQTGGRPEPDRRAMQRPRTAAIVGQRVPLVTEVGRFQVFNIRQRLGFRIPRSVEDGVAIHLVSASGARMQCARASVPRKQERLTMQKPLCESCVATALHCRASMTTSTRLQKRSSPKGADGWVGS